MAHFHIYGDESGKLAQSDYVSFCGYVAHTSEWERVSMEWNNVRLAWGVPPLHMRCVVAPERDKTGEWQKIKDEWGADWVAKRDRMLLEFGRAILGANTVAVGCIIDADHFRKMPDSQFKKGLPPVPFGFYHLIMESLDKIDRISKTLSVSIIVDDDHEYSMKMYEILNSLKKTFPRVRERISALTFGNDNDYPGLQMADMIAFESRRLMVERATAKDAPPSDLFRALTRNLIHQPKLWTAEYLDKAAKSNMEPHEEKKE
jgi:hypothetical protein